MADVKWIKITTDIFDDEKILFIEQLPDADSIIVIWFKLLTLAGKINNGGVLLFREDFPYTDEMLATIFRRPKTTVQLAIRTFQEFGMIEVINDTVTIPNWSKHQSLEQLKSRNEYMKNYMRDYRQKQKELAEGKVNLVNKNVNSKPNVSEAEIESDKESDKESDDDDKKNHQSTSSIPPNLFGFVEREWKKVRNQEVSLNNYKKIATDLIDKYKTSDIIAAINKINQSSYLKANVNIDWFLKEENFVKVLNDKYKDFETVEQTKKTSFHNFEQTKKSDEELNKLWEK